METKQGRGVGNTVQTAEIDDNAVTTAKINTSAVTTVKINDLAVTNAKIDTMAASKLTGQVAIANGGTGLNALGTANQVLGVNSGATGLEYKTLGGETLIGQYSPSIDTNIWQITGLSAYDFYRFAGVIVPVGGTLDFGIRFNNNSGAVYDYERKDNAAWANGSAANEIRLSEVDNMTSRAVFGWVRNISADVKALWCEVVSLGTGERTGATGRANITGSLIDEIDFLRYGGSTGQVDNTSVISVWGQND